MKIESELIEFKEDLSGKNKMKAEIVSFLNSKMGGTILLGVHDDGTQVEFSSMEERQEKYKDWEEVISNWIATAFAPDVSGLIQVQVSNDVFKISISSGPGKPYYYKDGEGFNAKGIYIRVGSTKRRASDDEVRRMILNNAAHDYENVTTEYKELDNSYISSAFRKKDIEYDAVRLGLKNEEGYYNRAGLILSDDNLYVTKIAVFEGLDMVTFVDKKEVIGSTPYQIDRALEYLWLVNREHVTITGAPARVSKFDYPNDALREAVLNAYSHRDYSISADIKIEIYDDRIRIFSPGAIPEGLSVDAIKEGANIKRNPLIVNALDKMGYIENYGSGINRIMKAYSGFEKQPTFSLTPDTFAVILYNMNYSTSVNQSTTELPAHSDPNDYQQQIINLLADGQPRTRKEIEGNLELKRTRVIELLQELIEDDVIEKTGKTKNSQYILRTNKG